jgi:hypothetical protein
VIKISNYNKEYYQLNKHIYKEASKRYRRKYFGYEKKRKKILEHKKTMKKLKDLMLEYCGGKF